MGMQARHDQVRPIVEQPISRSLKLFTGIWRRGIYYWIEVLFMLPRQNSVTVL